jgi:hypothetical protein
MKGIFIFKTQVYKNQDVRSTLSVQSFYFTNIFYESIFPNFFSDFRNIRDGENTSLVLILSPEDLGILNQCL